MKKILIIIFFLVETFMLFGLESIDSMKSIDSLLLDIKAKYIPDSREGIFDIKASIVDDTVFLSGKTTSSIVIKELLSKLDDKTNVLVNTLKLLPEKQLNDTLYGIVNVSVADIRTQNKFTSGMATQALLGMPVKLYEKDSWYRVQLPDSYFGWAHEKQIIPMKRSEFNNWILSSKIIYTKHYGFSYQKPDKDGATVSDLVAGNILKYEGIEGNYFKVSYPDRRIAYILRSESQEFSIWSQSRNPSGENFVEMAKSMMGIPYVWGGTSTKGFDCSGLVSTVLFLHGLTIKRDASQQAYIGEEVDITNGYDDLQVGDLLFFGTKAIEDKKENIRHVGFYIGENRFIHASGYVKINSLNPRDSDYDELNAKEFIKATRIINHNKLRGVDKLKDNPFYDVQK